ncbi:hypothetical protein D3C73_1309400 [compost metagenome]
MKSSVCIQRVDFVGQRALDCALVGRSELVLIGNSRRFDIDHRKSAGLLHALDQVEGELLLGQRRLGIEIGRQVDMIIEGVDKSLGIPGVVRHLGEMVAGLRSLHEINGCQTKLEAARYQLDAFGSRQRLLRFEL